MARTCELGVIAGRRGEKIEADRFPIDSKLISRPLSGSLHRPRKSCALLACQMHIAMIECHPAPKGGIEESELPTVCTDLLHKIPDVVLVGVVPDGRRIGLHVDNIGTKELPNVFRAAKGATLGQKGGAA